MIEFYFSLLRKEASLCDKTGCADRLKPYLLATVSLFTNIFFYIYEVRHILNDINTNINGTQDTFVH